MAKTHTFTKNSTGKPISIVLDKITGYERDEFSECTTIALVGGEKIGVSETVDEVKNAIEGA